MCFNHLSQEIKQTLLGVFWPLKDSFSIGLYILCLDCLGFWFFFFHIAGSEILIYWKYCTLKPSFWFFLYILTFFHWHQDWIPTCIFSARERWKSWVLFFPQSFFMRSSWGFGNHRSQKPRGSAGAKKVYSCWKRIFPDNQFKSPLAQFESISPQRIFFFSGLNSTSTLSCS